MPDADGDPAARTERLVGLGLCVLFLAIGLTTVFVWQAQDQNPITGDEPHYLVIADALVDDVSLELTEAYEREFATAEIYPPGLGAPDTEVTDETTHALDDGRGYYSVHGVGLPVVVAPAYALAGEVGARVVMVMIAALGVWALWWGSRAFETGIARRVAAVAPIATSMLVVTSATQLYPDVAVGVAFLVAVVWMLRVGELRWSETRVRRWSVAVGTLLAATPWFHLKVAPAAIVLGAALGVIAARRWGRRGWAVVAVPFVVSGVALMGYHTWAFGNPLGPYGDDAASAGTMPVVVLAGLYADQHQGILILCPALLFGLFHLVRFLRRFTLVGGSAIAAHLLLIVPNAIHPNWYGGYSFAGRFGVSAAYVVLPIAVFGLIRALDAIRSSVGRSVLVGVLLAWNALEFVRYAFLHRDLYNRLLVFPDSYGSGLPVVRDVLPMWYDHTWAFTYLPNLLWAILLVAVVVGGALSTEHDRRRLGVAVVAGAVVVAAVSLAVPDPRDEVRFEAGELSLGNAVRVDDSAVAVGGSGVVTFGPYLALDDGTYDVTVVFETAAVGERIGTWDVAVVGDGEPLMVDVLQSDEPVGVATFRLVVDDELAGRSFEVRTYSDGVHPLTVHTVTFADA